MSVFFRKNIFVIFIIVCISVSCTDINEVYNRNFNFYTFYKDMTIIENSGLLRTEDAQLLKSFIDSKILKDSVAWLKTKSYKELFFIAIDNAKKGNSNTVFDLSWKTNNAVHVNLSSFNTDKADMYLKINNITDKNIKYFRALLKFETNLREKIGQVDFIFTDTLNINSAKIVKYNDILVYKFKEYKAADIQMIPIIRRIVFTDSTEYLNPLSSYFN